MMTTTPSAPTAWKSTVIVLAVLLILLGACAQLGGAQQSDWNACTRTGIKLCNDALGADPGKDTIEAAKYFLSALSIANKFGRQDIRLVRSLNNLAWAYQDQRRDKEAESLYRRALAIAEKAAAPKHFDIDQRTILTNLAMLYEKQGKYAEAEPFYKQALTICERYTEPEALAMRERSYDLGQDEMVPVGGKWPDVRTSLEDLARVLLRQDKYAEAEPLYKRVLAMCEKLSGPEPHYLEMETCLSMLAEVYANQSKYAEAEPLYKRALAITEKAGNADSSLYVLAVFYERQGKYREAEPLLKRRLALAEGRRGPNDSSNVDSLIALADLYKDQGKYVEACPFFKRALQISENAFYDNRDWSVGYALQGYAEALSNTNQPAAAAKVKHLLDTTNLGWTPSRLHDAISP